MAFLGTFLGLANNREARFFVLAAAFMALFICLSNILVRFPVGDWLTFAAFTYPVTFLISDICNRTKGYKFARLVVYFGFTLATVLSFFLADPRIAFASSMAFAVSQISNVYLFSTFDKIFFSKGFWWAASLASSMMSGIIDTVLFFSVAFSSSMDFLGYADSFFSESILMPFSIDAPRWVGFALGDFAVKMFISHFMLIPFRIFTGSNVLVKG